MFIILWKLKKNDLNFYNRRSLFFGKVSELTETTPNPKNDRISDIRAAGVWDINLVPVPGNEVAGVLE